MRRRNESNQRKPNSNKGFSRFCSWEAEVLPSFGEASAPAWRNSVAGPSSRQVDDVPGGCSPVHLRMPSGFLRTVLSVRLRRLAGSLCLVAMMAQTALSGLHAFHEAGNLPLAGFSTDPSPALRAGAAGEHHGSRHDPAACPGCRTTSELRTLVSPAALAASPVVLALPARIPSDPGSTAQSSPGGLSARAPPLPA